MKTVISILHKHATCTTKFLINHQLSENIIMGSLYLPILYNCNITTIYKYIGFHNQKKTAVILHIKVASQIKQRNLA